MLSDVCSNVYLHKPSSDPSTSTPQKNFSISRFTSSFSRTHLHFWFALGIVVERKYAPLRRLDKLLARAKVHARHLEYIVSCASLFIVVLCTRTKPAIGSPRSMSALSALTALRLLADWSRKQNIGTNTSRLTHLSARSLILQSAPDGMDAR